MKSTDQSVLEGYLPSTLDLNKIMNNRFIPIELVMKLTSFGRSTIYKLSGSSDSDFPVRYQLQERRVGWKFGEIVEWLESREAIAKVDQPEEDSDIFNDND